MKTLRELIDEGSPIAGKDRFYYEIGTDFAHHWSTAFKNPDRFWVYKFFPRKNIAFFRKVDDRSKKDYPVVDGKVHIGKRHRYVDSLLNRPDKYQPFYTKTFESY